METKEGNEMLSTNKAGTDAKRPKIIVRKNGRKNGATVKTPMPRTEDTAMTTAPAEEPIITASATTITDDTAALTIISPSALPPLPGFSLDGVSRNQQYVIRNMLVFADCCVATTEDAVCDVIWRNFSDTGGLCWWLYRVGKKDLVPRLKGKDIIDAGRIVSHALHRQLKQEISLPTARW